MALFSLDLRFRFTAPVLFDGVKVEPAWLQANIDSTIQPIGATSSPIMRGVACNSYAKRSSLLVQSTDPFQTISRIILQYFPYSF